MARSPGKRPNAGDLSAPSGVEGRCAADSRLGADGLCGAHSRPREDARPGYLPRFFVEPAHSPAERPPVTRSAPAAPGTDRSGEELALDPEDSHHALRVLRLGVSDLCEVVVVSTRPGTGLGAPGAGLPGGRGGVAYRAVVTTTADRVWVRLVTPLDERQAGAGYANLVGIVQAMPRPAATDYLLEKATEAGASFFLLVPAAGSTLRSGASQGARLTRWRRIVREAAKQSKQLAVPGVEVMGSVEQALERLGPEALSLVLEPGASSGLYDAVVAARNREDPVGGARLALWVGPESGWTVEELERLSAAGAATVRLGRSVLRAETAGPVGVAVARLALGDW